MQDTSKKQSERLQVEMSNMQQVSEDATKEVGEYLENVKSHYTLNMFSANESRSLMENCLLDWSVFSFIFSVLYFFLLISLI